MLTGVGTCCPALECVDHCGDMLNGVGFVDRTLNMLNGVGICWEVFRLVDWSLDMMTNAGTG